jgi:hypothetical protein
MRPWALFVAVLLSFAAAGCASTQVVHEWRNPELAAPARFKKVMVVEISTQPGIRRSFEDEFVRRLKAAGVDAVASYRFIADDGPVPEPRRQEAAAQAGADATLITRLVRVEQMYPVNPYYYYPPPPRVFYRGYPWYGYYGPPAYPYEVYVSETSLYDAATNELVWSGTVETSPTKVSEDIPRYVNAVIEALQKQNLLAAAAPPRG